MRIFSLLPLAVLAGCAATPVQTAQAPDQRELAAALADRVQGVPQVCIPDREDLQVRSFGHNLVFKVGNDYYVNRVEGACDNPGTMGEIFLVDRGGKDATLCRHTNIRIVSQSAGLFGGNCNLGDFVPYRMPS